MGLWLSARRPQHPARPVDPNAAAAPVGPLLPVPWAQNRMCHLPTKQLAGGPGGFPPAQEEEQADSPYSSGGPSLLEKRVLSSTSTRQGTPYSGGGYSLLERRVLLTREAGTPYPKGVPSCLLWRRVLLTLEGGTPYSKGGYSLLARRTYL